MLFMSDLQVSKKQKQLREERLALMKQKVKEEFGRDLKIKYDKNVPDESDEELLALEADQVKDQADLPGKDLKEILDLSKPDGQDIAISHPLNRLAPIPSKDALFGKIYLRYFLTIMVFRRCKAKTNRTGQYSKFPAET